MDYRQYTFALMFLITYGSKVVSMDYERDWRSQIQGVGRMADIKAAQELLDAGMSVNEKGTLGYPMLVHAITYLHETQDNKTTDEKRLKFIEFVLSKGAQLHPKTSKWIAVPILQAATSSIGPDAISLLKKYGACVNFSHPYNGMTPLHLAAYNGKSSVVEYLLNQEDIVINPRDNEGATPLISAAFWGYWKIVKMLVDAGAKKDFKDKHDRSALDYAKRCFATEERANGEKTRNILEQNT